MNWEEKEDSILYKVLVNHEEQYAIWPVDLQNPDGWRDAGKRGLEVECLVYINEIWTDYP